MLLSKKKIYLKESSFSLFETFLTLFQIPKGQQERELSLCLICQEKIYLKDALATCQCACRMICHQKCLQEHHRPHSRCPLCNQIVPLISDTMYIWIDPRKMNPPFAIDGEKVKDFLGYGLDPKKNFAEFLNQIYLKLCSQAMKNLKSPLSTL